MLAIFKKETSVNIKLSLVHNSTVSDIPLHLSRKHHREGLDGGVQMSVVS